MGIYSPESPETNQAQSFNPKILLISLSLIIMFTSTSAFVVFEAAAVFEYAICFYFCITRPIALAVYYVIWLEMPQIIKFIGNGEQFITMSK